MAEPAPVGTVFEGEQEEESEEEEEEEEEEQVKDQNTKTVSTPIEVKSTPQGEVFEGEEEEESEEEDDSKQTEKVTMPTINPTPDSSMTPTTKPVEQSEPQQPQYTSSSRMKEQPPQPSSGTLSFAAITSSLQLPYLSKRPRSTSASSAPIGELRYCFNRFVPSC